MKTTIVIMGKTGNGKSTIVNAVMQSDVAPTGSGGTVTSKNEVYSRTMLLQPDILDNSRRVSCDIRLYDTVGLELDSDITKKTLRAIRRHIEESQRSVGDGDINLVWFCVNNRSNRFEPYEIELIKNLASDYEIPFIVVVTQCFSDDEGELERQIKNDLPEITVVRTLAKDYQTRAGVLPAFGLDELINKSVFDYDRLKIRVLASKWDALPSLREMRIEQIWQRANVRIEEYAKSAEKVGWIPGLCVPFVHGICIKMLYDLDAIVGIKTPEGFGKDIFTNVVIGLIVTPFMFVPFLSVVVAYAYVKAVGEMYLEALMNVMEQSTDAELHNIELMAERIKNELIRRNKK